MSFFPFTRVVYQGTNLTFSSFVILHIVLKKYKTLPIIIVETKKNFAIHYTAGVMRKIQSSNAVQLVPVQSADLSLFIDTAKNNHLVLAID